MSNYYDDEMLFYWNDYGVWGKAQWQYPLGLNMSHEVIVYQSIAWLQVYGKIRGSWSIYLDISKIIAVSIWIYKN